MDDIKFLEEESINKFIVKFSVPAIVAMFVNATYNIVDRMFISNIKDIGSIAISSIGITMPIVFFVFAFSVLIGLGAAANISISLGSKNFKEAEKFFGNAIIIGAIISIVLFISINFNLDSILYLLGASQNTLQYAKEYLGIISWGYLPLMLGFVMNAVMRSDGSPKMAMGTLLVGTITNIILDAVFIWGFNLGVAGAAYATVVAQIFSFLFTAYYFFSKMSNLKIKVEYFKLKKYIILRILSLGVAPFAIQAGTSITGFTMNVYLFKYGGDISIGAYTIINSIMVFFLLPIIGINQGIQPILGYNYGAKKYARVRETLYKAILIATIMSVIAFLAIQLQTEALIKFFTKSEELLYLSEYGIRRHALMVPLIGFQVICSMFFLAIGKGKLSLIMSLSRQVLILVPAIIILSSIWGMDGIWYAPPLSDFLSALITMYILRVEMKKHKELMV